MDIRMILFMSCAFPLLSNGLSARGGTEDSSEEWGYIPVRPGASMFYWFYRTTHPDGYLNRPIVLWLQGGPGLSGTGLGNFLEIGPLDHELEPRNSSWVQSVNLLFVDCPVGVGFSIVANKSVIPNNTDDISYDTIEMLRVFLDEHPDFKTSPFYIFGQSYGATLAAALGYHLHQAVQEGLIECNLKGVAMGNGCLSTLDTIVTWPILLYQMALLDHDAFLQMRTIADDIYRRNLTEDPEALKRADQKLMKTHFYNAPCVSLYNIFDAAPLGHFPDVVQDTKMFSLCSSYKSIYAVNISDMMNGPVWDKLGVVPDHKIWAKRNNEVYWAQVKSGDAYKPKWSIIDELLTSSDLDIIIYQGQLDLICSTAATIAWMQRLSWSGLEHYNAAYRETLTNPDTNVPEMFVKSHGHLKMYWVLNSGHVVPAEVPDVALRMLNRLLEDEGN